MSRDALVVGINVYTHLSGLKASAEDAEAIAQRLEQQGEFRVWRQPEVIDHNTPKVGKKTSVTLSELKRALVQLFKPEGKQVPDTALFYFSGHRIRDDAGIQEGFLATSDVNPQQGFLGLSLRWLRRLLQESPVRQQLVWLDCCHSGELLNFDEADPGERGRGRDRCFIAASREYQTAYELITGKHSVLTQAILDGLNPDRLPNRWIDNLVLTDFVNQALTGAIQSPVCNNAGEPIHLTRHWEIAKAHVVTIPPSTTCPYKGLAYFDCNEEDPKYFYGRTALTDQLLDRVRQGNFLAIFGASGSGKSSVLRAGLLHQLKLGQRVAGSDQWQFHIMLPGEHPLQSLALAFLDSQLSSIDRAAQFETAEKLLTQNSQGLRHLVQASGRHRVILVIDQFEESFALCCDVTERQQFFRCLMESLENTPQLCLIIAMRADFFSKCLEQDYSGLAKRIEQHLVTVTPMTRGELREAIAQPAKRANLSVEPELINQMIEVVEGSPGSLPLLQYTLTELWKQQTDGWLRLHCYTQLGGIAGTLQKHATAVYESLPKEQKASAQHIFLSLTQLGDGTEDTRRRVLRSDLVNSKHPEAIVNAVVQRLADEKLIVTSDVIIGGSNPQRVAVVDVAHEALIRHWQLLRQWLDERRDVLRQQRKIEAAAEEWRDRKKANGYLLQGRQLTEAQRFLKQQANILNISSLTEEFLRRSIRSRRISRLRLLGFSLIIPVAVSIWVRGPVTKYLGLLPHWQVLRVSEAGDDSPSLLRSLETLNKADQSLRRINLPQSNLRGIDLRRAYLDRAIFTGANFEGSLLNGAKLTRADLRGVNFSNAELSGANFAFSDFSNANLKNADLSRAYLTANFSNADLSRAKLEDARAGGANFSETNLSYVDLSKTYFNRQSGDHSRFDDVFGDPRNSETEVISPENSKITARILKNGKLCHTKLPEGVELDPNRDCAALGIPVDESGSGR